MPTISEVASLAGVSIASVSLYLNGKAKGRISPDKQKKIVNALRELNYVKKNPVKLKQSSYASHDVYTIGLFWATDARSSLLGEVVQGTLNFAKTAPLGLDFRIMICPFKPDELYKDKILIDPSNHGLDAAIIGNTSLTDTQFLNSITPDIPIVLFNRNLPQYHSVTIDNNALGACVAKLIAERGFNSCAVFRALSPFPALNSRMDGFVTECRRSNILLPNMAVYFIQDSIEDSMKAAENLLDLASRPKVLFCDSDLIALGALHVFNKVGLKIPDDLSIICVGMNCIPAIISSVPSLTSVDLPISQISKECMKVLSKVLHNETSDILHIELSTSITLRESFV